MKLNNRLDLNINRREWLKLAGAGAAYATLAGCGTLTRSPKGPPYARPLSALPFGRPNIDSNIFNIWSVPFGTTIVFYS